MFGSALLLAACGVSRVVGMVPCKRKARSDRHQQQQQQQQQQQPEKGRRQGRSSIKSRALYVPLIQATRAIIHGTSVMFGCSTARTGTRPKLSVVILLATRSTLSEREHGGGAVWTQMRDAAIRSIFSQSIAWVGPPPENYKR